MEGLVWTSMTHLGVYKGPQNDAIFEWEIGFLGLVIHVTHQQFCERDLFQMVSSRDPELKGHHLDIIAIIALRLLKVPYLGVAKNNATPKWMVKIMVPTLLKWMIWGGFPPIFGGPPISCKLGSLFLL